jgi:hypothetical protein
MSQLQPPRQQGIQVPDSMIIPRTMDKPSTRRLSWGSDLLEQVHDSPPQVGSAPMASLVASPSARMALR